MSLDDKVVNLSWKMIEFTYLSVYLGYWVFSRLEFWLKDWFFGYLCMWVLLFFLIRIISYSDFGLVLISCFSFCSLIVVDDNDSNDSWA